MQPAHLNLREHAAQVAVKICSKYSSKYPDIQVCFLLFFVVFCYAWTKAPPVKSLQTYYFVVFSSCDSSFNTSEFLSFIPPQWAHSFSIPFTKLLFMLIELPKILFSCPDKFLLTEIVFCCSLVFWEYFKIFWNEKEHCFRITVLLKVSQLSVLASSIFILWIYYRRQWLWFGWNKESLLLK